jgi:hypothetical protein
MQSLVHLRAGDPAVLMLPLAHVAAAALPRRRLADGYDDDFDGDGIGTV